MPLRLTFPLLACFTLAMTACDTKETAHPDNPLLSASPLSLNYPLFDQIKDSHFAPAFDNGMAAELQEIEMIARQSEAPTFENTIIALQRSGTLLRNAQRIFYNLNATDTNDVRQQLNREYAPKFAAHRDSIMLNETLFARVDALHHLNEQEPLDLDPESLRLIERYHTAFVRAGAELGADDKARLKSINAELASLSAKFSDAVLDEVNASALVVDTVEELDGLTQTQISAAAEEAKARELDGKYVLTLLNTTRQPLLPQLNHRPSRERLHHASVARGSRGNEFDTTSLVSEVLKLRDERAKLLGYANHAAFVLADETAGSVENVNAMLGQLAPAALANARKEAADLQAMIDAEQAAKGEPTFELQPWDWTYYTDKVQKARFEFDDNELKPYFELRNVLENGVFYAATRFYGISFQANTELPKYHPDTSVYDVFDADGSQLAIFIFDPYARSSKRGGAWMNAYVTQSVLEGTQPVIANHLNIPKPPTGEPTLLTWDEVTTAFHEFGHALHGMFSNVTYPYFSGTNVPRDFVEFPSQVNEMWAAWPEILTHYAKHYQTDEPLPQALLERKLASSTFNEGFATTEYLSAAMLDQYLHQLPAEHLPSAGEVMAIEAEALKSAGLDYTLVPPRYRTPYFSHIMGGYSAGYYAYIWSEVLDANTVEWIKANGGLKRENGDHFRQTLLSRGGSQDAAQLFRDFIGHDPKIEPLLVKRGLTSQLDSTKKTDI